MQALNKQWYTEAINLFNKAKEIFIKIQSTNPHERYSNFIRLISWKGHIIECYFETGNHQHMIKEIEEALILNGRSSLANITSSSKTSFYILYLWHIFKAKRHKYNCTYRNVRLDKQLYLILFSIYSRYCLVAYYSGNPILVGMCALHAFELAIYLERPALLAQSSAMLSFTLLYLGWVRRAKYHLDTAGKN